MSNVSKEFWEDLLWSEEHYSELMENFPDKWVAIVDKKAVYSGESIKVVENEAEKITGRNKSEIPIVFVECGAHIYFKGIGDGCSDCRDCSQKYDII